MITRHVRHHGVAYLALVVALSTGTSYAAAQLANGSVTTKKLAKNAVVSKKVKDGALSGVDLRDGSLTAADLAAGSVGTTQVGDGSLVDDDLATGSVGSAEVKNGSLTAPDLAAGSVGSGEVKDGSLTAADLAAAAVPQILVSHGANPTPVAAPDGAALDANLVTVPRAGQVYVRWSKPSFGVTCSSGGANLGLYVDGAAVSGTSTPVPSVASASFVELVGSVALTAAPHTFTVRIDCPASPPNATIDSVGGAGGVTWTTIVPGA